MQLRRKCEGKSEAKEYFSRLEKSLLQEGHTEHLTPQALVRLEDYISHVKYYLNKIKISLDKTDGFIYRCLCFLKGAAPIPHSIKLACQAYVEKAQLCITQIETFRLNAILARLEHASRCDDIENVDVQHYRVKQLYDLEILQASHSPKSLPYYPSPKRLIDKEVFTHMVNHLIKSDQAQRQRLLRIRAFSHLYNFQNVIPIDTTLTNGDLIFFIKDAPQTSDTTFFNASRAFEIARINQLARELTKAQSTHRLKEMTDVCDKLESQLLSEIKKTKKAKVPWIINALFKPGTMKQSLIINSH